MYLSKLFLVSVAALLALFAHSPTTGHVGKPNQVLRYHTVLSDIYPTGSAGQCCAGDIVGSLSSYVAAAFPAHKQYVCTGKIGNEEYTMSLTVMAGAMNQPPFRGMKSRAIHRHTSGLSLQFDRDCGISIGTWTGADGGSGCGEDVTEVDFRVKSLKIVATQLSNSQPQVNLDLHIDSHSVKISWIKRGQERRFDLNFLSNRRLPSAKEQHSFAESPRPFTRSSLNLSFRAGSSYVANILRVPFEIAKVEFHFSLVVHVLAQRS
ncbi:hypothetical protein C8R44DRAFT_738288 [Mycena epipterygia]|nr:hypothetical protein C8R44DRAFT_738288 [Mycena epipterygia]